MNPSFKSHFLLDPNITYLNFGAYGACANPIFENYQYWQRHLESEPVQFFTVNGLKYLQQSREALAGYVHCKADDLVYVTSPTYGVNIIAKSLNLQPGDEVLSTDLEYGACDKIWNYYCSKAGATYVRQHISMPLTSKEKIVAEFVRGINKKTKAIFISHITSATALILPVEQICAIARDKGILIFVDGAHVPGHIPVNISSMSADIYTGACHKWMMTPKSSSFLYVKKELQHLFDPLLISWGYDKDAPPDTRFIDFHQGQGTRDYSAFLTIPESIRFMKEHNWIEISAQCKAIVRKNAPRFCELAQTNPTSDITEEFIGQMFSFPVSLKDPERFQRLMLEKYRIEVPVMKQDGKRYIRYSINAFNSPEDLDRLYDAMKENMHEFA
jgi:isopenicillin-N epimerase